MCWMLSYAVEYGEKWIASKAVHKFPQFFRSTVNSNLARASRLWKERGNYPVANRRNASTVISRVSRNGPTMVRMNARKGRGRRREAWVEALQNDIRSEFERLRNRGVKFNISSLSTLA